MIKKLIVIALIMLLNGPWVFLSSLCVQSHFIFTSLECVGFYPFLVRKLMLGVA